MTSGGRWKRRSAAVISCHEKYCCRRLSAVTQRNVLNGSRIAGPVLQKMSAGRMSNRQKRAAVNAPTTICRSCAPVNAVMSTSSPPSTVQRNAGVRAVTTAKSSKMSSTSAMPAWPRWRLPACARRTLSISIMRKRDREMNASRSLSGLYDSSCFAHSGKSIMKNTSNQNSLSDPTENRRNPYARQRAVPPS